jgi:hypothetical protein
VVLAAIVGVVGFLLATGQSRSLRDLAVAAIAVATFAYVVVIAFRLALVAIAQWASVLGFTPGELGDVNPETLPAYSILVPLYREDKVLAALLAKLSAGCRFCS